jgi:hypothetical protein
MQEERYEFSDKFLGFVKYEDIKKMNESKENLGSYVKDFARTEIDSETLENLHDKSIILKKGIEAREDQFFDDTIDILYPLSHILPALAYFTCLVAFSNLLIVPTFILLYSSLYFYTNSKRNSIKDSGNIAIGLAVVLSITLVTFGALTATGITMFLNPLIIPITISLNVILFVFGLARDISRDHQARNINHKNIKDAISELEKLKKIRNLHSNHSEILYSNNEDVKDAEDENTSKYLFLYNYIKALSKESSYLVRTIKNPFTKYFIYYRDCIERENLLKETLASSDHPLVRSLHTDSEYVKKYLRRDLIWFSMNICVVVASILLFTPFIPISLSLSIMISIFCFSIVAGLGNISARLFDKYFFEKKNEIFELKSLSASNKNQYEIISEQTKATATSSKNKTISHNSATKTIWQK